MANDGPYIADVSVAASNALLLIGDSMDMAIPSSIVGLVASTPSCVAVGTLEETDGPTRVRVVNGGDAEEQHMPPREVLDMELETPSGRIAVSSVLGETYVEHMVDRPSIRIRLRVNDPSEPDDIVIILG